MEDLFQIGEIAKIFHLPVKTIRYYSDIGILPPVYINPETGYRYYSIDQFVYIDIIRNYRKMGMSLDQIADIMLKDYKTDDIISVLEGQINKAEEKIKEYKRIKKAMEKLAEVIKYMDNAKKNEPFIENLESQKYFSFPYESRNPDEQEINFRKAALSKGEKADHIYTIYGVSTDAKLYFNEGIIYNPDIISYFSNLDNNAKERRLKKGRYACIIFDDNVRNKEIYYKKLSNYIKKNNYKTDGDFTEEWIIPHLKVKKETTLIRLKIRLKD